MPVLLKEYVQDVVRASEDYAEAKAIATSLLNHLNSPDIQVRLILANQPNAPSGNVQNVFLEFAIELVVFQGRKFA